MARIKLQIPEAKLASISIPVRITDVNYGNHVGNDSLVAMLHEARVQWLGSLQFTELDAGGTGLIMSDLAVEYLNESFYGDLLIISLYAGEITSAGFEIYYLVETNRNEQTKIIARAKTGMVCFNYSARKVAALPQQLRDALRGSTGLP